MRTTDHVDDVYGILKLCLHSGDADGLRLLLAGQTGRSDVLA